MTISSETRKAGPYSGNDATTEFSFAFKVFAATDVVVVKTVTATEVETTLTNVTDYTVGLNADQDANPGGTVTLPAALATGYTLTLTSDVPMLQAVDLTNQGGFYPSVINSALDRLTILLQQVAEETDRSVKVQISSTTDPDDLLTNINASVAAAAASETAAAASETAAAASAAAAALFDPANFQPVDAQLTTLAGITAQQATDLASLSTFVGTVLNDASGDAVYTTLGAAKSHAADGYQKLPSGLIIQWGTEANPGASTSTTVTFPLEFPTGVFIVQATVDQASALPSPLYGIAVTSKSTTGCVYDTNSGSATKTESTWFAIGY
jgi:hypothetical protein